MLSFDIFGQSFNFSIDQGLATLPSKMGTFCSFIVFLLIMTYAGYKTSILAGKKDI